jgi:hypothetical protein
MDNVRLFKHVCILLEILFSIHGHRYLHAESLHVQKPTDIELAMTLYSLTLGTFE